MAPWSPDFDIQKDFQDKVSVWIELPYRVVTLKDSQKEVIKSLGLILHFVQGDEANSYPHGRACILWDMSRLVPKWLQIWLDPTY